MLLVCFPSLIFFLNFLFNWFKEIRQFYWACFCGAGFFSNNHSRKSGILRLDAQKLEGPRGVCTDSHISNWSFCIHRAPSSACYTSSSMFVTFCGLKHILSRVIYIYFFKKINQSFALWLSDFADVEWSKSCCSGSCYIMYWG